MISPKFPIRNMVATLCQSGSVLIKAGANVSTNFKTTNGEPNLVPLINQAEGFLSSAIRVDLVAGFAGYNSNTKLILEDACASWAAIDAIKYDMSGYTSRVEAEDMINVCFEKIKQVIQILTDPKGTSFVTK